MVGPQNKILKFSDVIVAKKTQNQNTWTAVHPHSGLVRSLIRKEVLTPGSMKAPEASGQGNTQTGRTGSCEPLGGGASGRCTDRRQVAGPGAGRMGVTV